MLLLRNTVLNIWISEVMKSVLSLAKLGLALMVASLISVSAAEADRPNVVLILTDDQGSLDLNIYGAQDLHTPHLDRLAERGVRFNQFYVGSSVCSPSRASILTGKSPQGAGLTVNAPRNEGFRGLPPSQVTVAEMLQESGYATAHIGKWHLGHTPGLRPEDQGFEYTFGHMEGCIDNYSHFFYWVPPNRHDLWENGKEVFETGYYFQDSLVEKARRFVADNRERPFFIFFSTNLPHYPLQPDRKWQEYYKDLPMPRRDYAACVSTIDERVGQLMETLEAYDELDDTIIVFLSDHGHSCEERTFGGGGYAGAMRGAKFGFFEAGIRVPAIISGPGLPEGKVVEKPAMAMDIVPTLAELCGIDNLPDSIEGTSLVGLIERGESLRETMFWKRREQWAVRRGDWKLLVNPRDDSNSYPLDPDKDKVFLANLKMDLAESENLASKYPKKVEELVALYKDWEYAAEEDFAYFK